MLIKRGKKPYQSKLPLLLALDQGGHSTRAIVFDLTGEVVARTRVKVGISIPRSGWVEQDAGELAASLTEVLDQTARLLGPDVSRLSAAGLATQRSNVVCWHRETGDALTSAISWQDRRASPWIRQFAPWSDQVHQITGLYLSAHYGAGKLRWCLDRSAAVKRALQKGTLACGPLASFLAWRLLGSRPYLVDPANAARTLLWSLQRKDWDPQLLDMFAVPRQLLPRCVESDYPFGEIMVGDRPVKLRCLTGDQSAALFVAGPPEPARALINLGTGAFVQRATGERVLYVPGLLSGIALHTATSTTYTLEGTVNGAGSALDWLQARQPGLDLLANLDSWLNEVVAPPLFLNGIAGLGAPWWLADFKSRFIGGGRSRDRAVAVIESIVFLLTVNLQRMAVLEPPLHSIIVTGGLAVLDGLCQKLADLNEVQVIRPAECEATARGLAWLLGERRRPWEPKNAALFDPRDGGTLQDRFRHWQHAMERAMVSAG